MSQVCQFPSLPRRLGLKVARVILLVMRRRLFVLALGAALASVLSLPSAAGTDPYLIVPWHQIGSARLGMSRSALHGLYGNGGYADPYVVTWAVPGGTLSVGFAGTPQLAVDFNTLNPRVHTPDGVRIGSHLPLGPCHRMRRTACQHLWHGFVYHPVDRQGTPAQWLGSFCDQGIHEFVRFGYTHGAIDDISMWYDAGVCGRKIPPLSAAVRAAITLAVIGHVHNAQTKVSDFRGSRDGRWASVWISGKGKLARHIQPAFVVLHDANGRWVEVDLGTRRVGCSNVPIKPLTQIGGGCGPDSVAP